MVKRVIGSGAEATISFEDGKVLKERLVKRYRHPLLDLDLRRTRTRREAKILQKLPVPSPHLFSTDRESKIEMEFLDGPQLKEILDDEISWAERVGEYLGRMHEMDIIHGDLTTSNMIVRDGTLHFIDFGLSFTSPDIEHKAVDIHLFKQALESKHHTIFEKAYRQFVRGYRSSQSAEAVLDRLKIVERRGRNKTKV